MDYPPRTRREFLGGAAAAALAVGAARADSPVPPQPIVDTHQHLWDLTRFRLPWLAAEPKLNRTFWTQDYQRATEGLNVVKAVYMEVAVDPSQQAREAEGVVELIRGRTSVTAAAVISGRPASEGFAAYLDRFKNTPEIKGLRQVLHGPETPPGYCLAPEFVRGIRRLGEVGWSFDLCVRPAELRDAAKLVDACPGTNFVLDHCGNAEVFTKDRSAWKADIAEVARRDRVVCKVSGIVASTKGRRWTPDDLAPIVNHVLDVFGPDRVVFGGDWPVCTLGASLAQWVGALEAVVRDRTAAQRRKLFHDNAVRVYRLG